MVGKTMTNSGQDARKPLSELYEESQAKLDRVQKMNQFLYTQLEALQSQAEAAGQDWLVEKIQKIWETMEEKRI